MALSKIEYEILDKKYNNPDEKVFCPHCNDEIVIETFDSGCVIKCKRGCIKDTIRGI